MGFRVLAFILLLVFSSPAIAVEIHLLFERGQFNRDYDNIVRPGGMRRGDYIAFSDGSRFVFDAFAGHGGSNRILRVFKVAANGAKEGPYALRLPLRANENYSDLLDDYAEGHKYVESLGLLPPKLESRLKGQYILTEFVEHDPEVHNGKRFLQRLDELDPEFRQKALISMKQFARDTAPTAYIDDFRADQMIYDSRLERWRILDWKAMDGATQAKMAFNPGQKFPTVFDSFEKRFAETNEPLPETARSVIERLRREVVYERVRRTRSGECVRMEVKARILQPTRQ